MSRVGKENRMSRVQLPEFEGGTLEEYMYPPYHLDRSSTPTRRCAKRQASIWRPKRPSVVSPRSRKN